MLEGEAGSGGQELHPPELVIRSTTDPEAHATVDPILDRRKLLQGSSLLLAGSALPGCTSVRIATGRPHPSRLLRGYRAAHVPLVLGHGEPQERAGARPLADAAFCSIAAVGFALPAYAIGVERGWCTRAEARDLTLTTLRFFWNAPQGPERERAPPATRASSTTSSIWRPACAIEQVELSSVDTTILLMGVLFAGQYYDRDDAAEREIRDSPDDIYARADWNFFRRDGRAADLHGLASRARPDRAPIGSATTKACSSTSWRSARRCMPVPPNSWEQWTAPYPRFWRGEGPTRRLAFAPLFGHQYSHIFIDFRGIRDAPMRAAGFDYFENSRRATYANRAYCIGQSDALGRLFEPTSGASPPATGRATSCCRSRASSEPSTAMPRAGRSASRTGATTARSRRPRRSARCRSRPEIVIPAAEALLAEHGTRIFDKYGFEDSFNPSFTYTDKKLETGSVDPRHGWVATRLSRHRPGADPAAGRELPRRIRLAVHAAGAGDPARPEASRIYRRLARLISASAPRLSFETPVSLNASTAT